MKIELNVFEIPANKLQAIARFLNDLAGGVADAPKPAAASTVSEIQATTTTSAPNTDSAHFASVDLTDLDKNGLPWDARIHSGAKGKNQDGTWKALRNGDKSIIPAVEAELRALVANAGNVEGADDSQVPPPPPPVNTAAASSTDTPPPPPPPVNNTSTTITPQDSEGHEVTFAMAFKRFSQSSEEVRKMALEMLDMKAAGEFVKVKDDASKIQSMWDNLIALMGEE